ncbi:MAG TPA: DUF418 domain-containing protein [Bacteroidota bacterium]|nr:DUF418 domain-containing protein [Bacteroidota bacterium]
MQISAIPSKMPERIAVVDILRGFALGGILAANMADFTSPYFAAPLEVLWPQTHNRIVLGLIEIFVINNFFTIFSFLFGLGLALQMMRLEARGIRFVPLYLRRQSVLLAIGLLQGLFIWYGDILAPYALFGCLLLLVRRLDPKRLALIAAAFILIPVTISLVRLTVTQPASHVSPALSDPVMISGAITEASRVTQIYAHGSWSEIFTQRANELVINYNGWIGRSYGLTVAAMFLLGLAAGKLKLFQSPELFRSFARRFRVPGLVCLFITGAGVTIRMTSAPGTLPFVAELIFYQFMKIAHIVISFFYISSVTLLAWRPRSARMLSVLAAPGRMALTNYLLQSIICTTIFNSYGLGLFGSVSPAAGLGMTAVFFSAQVAFSNWFLSRFRFGPAEWLWKSLTYGTRQPFLIGLAPLHTHDEYTKGRTHNDSVHTPVHRM